MIEAGVSANGASPVDSQFQPIQTIHRSVAQPLAQPLAQLVATSRR
jgi:hypothetical protein